MMTACTLFEKTYHFGVAALVNSLYRNGFRGDFYAGYTGPLPHWASAARNGSGLDWAGMRTLAVAPDMRLHFLPVQTGYHLTNYKPDFMLQLWERLGGDADSMFFFDPDILVARPWRMFAEWVACGVALCEDVNSPLPRHHPRREAWRNYYAGFGIHLSYRDAMYANGGFIGLNRDHMEFLELWKTVQEKMGLRIGGLGRSMFTSADHLETAGGAFFPFAKTDQDALNAAVEAYDRPVSFVCKDGMGFEEGVQLMHHALGTPKPWEWKPFSRLLAGYPPRPADQLYWQTVASGPLMPHPRSSVRYHRLAISIARGAGRFYHRN